MKKGLVVSDSGPVFSLAIIDKLWVLDSLFEEIFIPKAVWLELTKDKTSEHYPKINEYFQNKVKEISGFNELTFIMDFGESESVLLFKELNADYLLIDDKKARDIAENLGIQCIGTIGVLSIAKERGLIKELRPLFESFLQKKRFYSLKLLNGILLKYDEREIEIKPG
jgi:predicted nucleic acid-binding protein